MKKIYALLLSISIVLTIFGTYTLLSHSNKRETVVLTRAIDGDTADLEDGRRVRFLNINTPEKTQPFYQEAKDYLKQYENQTLELESEGTGDYGRTLGRLYKGDKYINLEIISLGLAQISHINEDEEKKFVKAQEKARKSQLGIWKHSPKYGCLKAEIEKQEEYVIITNNCGNIEGFTLKDESTTDFQFPKSSESEIILFSAGGLNNSTAFFWGRGNAWNNDKDSIFIRDKQGLLIYYDSYGH